MSNTDALQAKLDTVVVDRDALLDAYQQVLRLLAYETLQHRSADSIADWLTVDLPFHLHAPVIADLHAHLRWAYKRRRDDAPRITLADVAEDGTLTDEARARMAGDPPRSPA